jgi:hypothetical protein
MQHATPITIEIHTAGSPGTPPVRLVGRREVIGYVSGLSAEVVRTRGACERAYAALGHALLLVRDRYERGAWGGFLGECGVNQKTAARAMKIAELYADAAGQIDPAKVREVAERKAGEGKAFNHGGPRRAMEEGNGGGGNGQWGMGNGDSRSVTPSLRHCVTDSLVGQETWSGEAIQEGQEHRTESRSETPVSDFWSKLGFGGGGGEARGNRQEARGVGVKALEELGRGYRRSESGVLESSNGNAKRADGEGGEGKRQEASGTAALVAGASVPASKLGKQLGLFDEVAQRAVAAIERARLLVAAGELEPERMARVRGLVEDLEREVA